MFEQFKRWMWLQRQGMLYGSLVGLAIGFLYSRVTSTAFAISGGLLNSIAPAEVVNPVTLGQIKFILIFGLVGMMTGMFFDALYEPKR